MPVAEAPGRVNLLGDHTDYNDGFVLPVAIAQRTRVAIAAQRRRGLHAARRGARTDGALFPSTHRPPSTSRATSMAAWCWRARQRADVPGLEIEVSSEVPMGVGLSSSAALGVATLRCLRQLLDLPFDDVQVARMAQAGGEGVRAGGTAASWTRWLQPGGGRSRAADRTPATLQRRDVPLPEGSAVLVLDSGVAPQRARTAAICSGAANASGRRSGWGVASLRDVQRLQDIERLPDLLKAAGAPRAHRERPRAARCRMLGRGGVRPADERLAREPARRLRSLHAGAGPARVAGCRPRTACTAPA
jgi:galactokinase